MSRVVSNHSNSSNYMSLHTNVWMAITGWEFALFSSFFLPHAATSILRLSTKKTFPFGTGFLMKWEEWAGKNWSLSKIDLLTNVNWETNKTSQFYLIDWLLAAMQEDWTSRGKRSPLQPHFGKLHISHVVDVVGLRKVQWSHVHWALPPAAAPPMGGSGCDCEFTNGRECVDDGMGAENVEVSHFIITSTEQLLNHCIDTSNVDTICIRHHLMRTRTF